jgi:ribose 5-phosphate isomerase
MQQRLKLVDEGKIPEVDVVFDGADEVDAKLNMVKVRRARHNMIFTGFHQC